MREKYDIPFRKKILATAITTSLGVASAGLPGIANSDIYTWGSLNGAASSTTTCAASPNAATVKFTMLDADGAAIANTSIPAKGNNQFQTATCGTLVYDTETDSATAEIGAFDFFAGTLPAVAKGITISRIPTASAPGNRDGLLLANMLFDWNGNVGIPVSLAWEALNLLGEMDGTPTSFTLNADGSIASASAFTNTGEYPASDGTYVGAGIPGTVTGPGGYAGYLGLGPSPIATTSWNTTLGPGCSIGACDNVSPSGVLPLITDTVPNVNDFAPPVNLGGTIGGAPMASGGFQGSNANFDYTSMTLASFTDTTPPVITLSGTQGTVINKTEGDSYVEDGATCTDAAPLNTNLNGSVVTGGDTIPDPLTVAGSPFTVTYNCQDASLNDAVQLTRTINVSAAGVPVISLLGTSPVNHECATAYDDAGATCNDSVDGDISEPFTPPQDLSLSTASLNVNTVATQSVTWSCTNSSNVTATQDRSVVVEDTTDPVVTLLGDEPQDIVSSTTQNPVPSYTDPGATISDSCDTAVTGTIYATSGTVDLVVPDTGAATLPYGLSYTTTDADGNVGTATRTVNVTRSQPVITLIGGGESLQVGDTYTEQGMNISDAQDLPGGDLTNVTTSGTEASGLSYTINGTVDTNKGGEYTITYDATDSNGNLATQLSRTVTVGGYASGSNFSMLDSNGNVFGGTNDVVFDWDGTSFNTDETDTNFGYMTIASALPQKFFSFVWTAHNIRVYQGPPAGSGLPPVTLSFDTTCTVAQLEAGLGSETNPCNGPLDPGQSQQFITMTIAEGQIGAHILFDWNTSDDIDVVNVWDQDGVWDRHGGTDQTNKLWDGPAGDPPDETTTWKLVSTDFDGDGINASPMIDGPFQGSNANFNAGPGASLPPAGPYVGTAQDTKLGSGLVMNIWGVLVSLFTLLGLRRFSK